MIKYLIIDVDGTLTDGGVYYDDNDNEIKKFCTKDGTGIICALAAGINVMVLTGRECRAVKRRLSELGVSEIYQNVKDKAEWMRAWMLEQGIDRDSVGYIGDDVNDLAPMRLCGFVGCPEDACVEVKEIATYISPVRGGYGAVRSVIEWYLKQHEIWDDIISVTYRTGT